MNNPHARAEANGYVVEIMWHRGKPDEIRENKSSPAVSGETGLLDPPERDFHSNIL
jgi:hypothetical protein